MPCLVIQIKRMNPKLKFALSIWNQNNDILATKLIITLRVKECQSFNFPLYKKFKASLHFFLLGFLKKWKASSPSKHYLLLQK